MMQLTKNLNSLYVFVSILCLGKRNRQCFLTFTLVTKGMLTLRTQLQLFASLSLNQFA